MRKMNSLLFAAVMSITLTGCAGMPTNGGLPSSNVDENNSIGSTQQIEEEVSIEDIIAL